VLLITFDTTRADAVGYANGRADVTPNLDKLAAAGTWFSTAITTQPLTVPSHSSIMTGLFPFHHGARNNGTFVLEKKNLTLAEMLKGAGYATHAIVSSYVLDSQFGLDQGFDVYDDDLSGGPQQKMFMFREIRGNQTADKAVAWLKKDRPAKQPFFLWVHFFDPHADYDPPADLAQRFPGERYQAEVAFADRQLGRVLATLDELKLRKNTLIVMSGDHGEALGDHGERTHGIFVYDSTIHVPMLFSGAGIPRQRRVDALVRTVDIVPTITAILHLDPPKVDGASLLPLMRGEKEKPRMAYSESFAPRLNFGWAELRAERSQDMKFIDAPHPEAYDLRRDAGEMNNLLSSTTLPSTARPLVAQLRTIEKSDPSARVHQGQARLDAESRQKLAALGYVWSHEKDTSGPRADPKDRIAHWELFEEAQAAIRRREYPQALQMVRAVLAVDKDNVVAMASLANVLSKMNDRQDALQVYKRMIDVDPERDTGYLGATRVLREMGRFEEAEAYARTANRLQPQNPEALTSLGDVFLDQNRFADAEPMFRQAVKLDPHSSVAISGLGNCLNRAGRLREALAILREGHQHDPTSQAIAYNLAVVVERLGDPEGAKKLYEAALKIDSDHSMTWNNLGALYDRSGNREQAIRCMVRARQADPTNIEAAYNLGVLLMGAQKLPEALPQLEDALRLNPRFVPAAVQRARLLMLLDRKQESLAAWRQLTDTHPAAWLQVARLELALGNERQARDALRQAIDRGGDRIRQAASKDERLRRLMPASPNRS
jgi:arylsulfatase A-like enzyme/Tfp pilus assembly protein PilF